MQGENSMYELFTNIDANQNGIISLKEFIDYYMDAFLRLEEERVNT